jgi:two-component system, NarL family, nitrate/nitrite response regulator NarL
VISQHSAHLIPTALNGAMHEPAHQSRIRLVLLDDHVLFRASLGHLLASEPDFEVAGECGSSAEALEALRSSTVDVVLLDFDVGTEHGSDFIGAARQAGYRGRFLIVAGSTDVRNAAIALKLGVSGIFLKSEAPDRLVQAIRLVGNGGIWVDQRIIQLLAEQSISRYPRYEDQKFSGPLEDRERNVLLGILEGLTNRKIGDNLGLSESSVKNIVQRLFGKAGVKTRSGLVREALEGSLRSAQEFIKQPNEMLNREPGKSNEHPRQSETKPLVGRQSDE